MSDLKETTEAQSAEPTGSQQSDEDASEDRPFMTTAQASADLFSEMVELQRQRTEQAISSVLEGVMKTYGLK